MNFTKELFARAESKCELCNDTTDLQAYTVPPRSGSSIDHHIVVCHTCKTQLDSSELIDPNHWRCLNESIWSIVPAVQVVSYRMLKKLDGQSWARDLLNMIELETSVIEWAEDTDMGVAEAVHKDSNGTVLLQGDTVVLIQDLNVKGANFIAKRGTTIKRITLVHENPEHIEGKVNDQHIVILTKYVKKSN
ncbi:MAG: PhnA domain-containing protein [Saprospiraceae bacterium]